MLSADQIHLIFDLIREKYGTGYAKEPEIRRLQGALSVMLEVARKMEDTTCVGR